MKNIGIYLLLCMFIYTLNLNDQRNHQKDLVILNQENNLNYYSQDSSSIKLYYLVNTDTVYINIKK